MKWKSPQSVVNQACLFLKASYSIPLVHQDMRSLLHLMSCFLQESYLYHMFKFGVWILQNRVMEWLLNESCPIQLLLLFVLLLFLSLSLAFLSLLLVFFFFFAKDEALQLGVGVRACETEPEDFPWSSLPPDGDHPSKKEWDDLLMNHTWIVLNSHLDKSAPCTERRGCTVLVHQGVVGVSWTARLGTETPPERLGPICDGLFRSILWAVCTEKHKMRWFMILSFLI